MHKHAFKLGFCFKLAEARVSPSQLADVFGLEKVADKKEKAEGGSPTMGFGADEVTGALKPVALGLSGGLAASTVVPTSVGRLLGGVLATRMSEQMDTTDELRTRYLIKRYRDYIQERKAQLNNRLISEAVGHG